MGEWSKSDRPAPGKETPGLPDPVIDLVIDGAIAFTGSAPTGLPREYTEPKYFDGRIDRRSDIDSIATMISVAVTGRFPFNGKTATRTILMVLRDPGPAIDPAIATG